jgi:hypothetical protein
VLILGLAIAAAILVWVLAFVTKQRFEMGPLRPPMAQFERVQHLADQMGIMGVIVGRLRGDGERGPVRR